MIIFRIIQAITNRIVQKKSEHRKNVSHFSLTLATTANSLTKYAVDYNYNGLQTFFTDPKTGNTIFL